MYSRHLVKVSFFHLMTMLSLGVFAGLPNGYTRLEYIESTGAQYIDTGVRAKAGVSAEGDFAWVASSGDASLLGAKGGDNRCFLFYSYNRNWAPSYGAWNKLGTQESNGTRYYVTASFAAGVQTLAVNGSTLYTGTVGDAIDTGMNLYLFADNLNGTASGKSKVRLWGMKIYDDGSLVRHYVPVKNGENAAGLYDLVNDEFKAPVGSAFSAGAAIASPWTADTTLTEDVDLRGQGVVAIDYRINLDGHRLYVDSITGLGEVTDATACTRLEYVQSNGSQWIDTGIVGRSNISCEADLIVYDTSGASNDRHLLAASGNGQQCDLIGAFCNRWYLGYTSIGGATKHYKYDGWIANGTRYSLSSKLHVGEQWCKVNGTTVVSGSSAAACDTGMTLYVFAFNVEGVGAKSFGSGRIYSLSIATNEVPARSFIPAKRNSDGAFGLYDSVTDAFFPNGSATALAAGEERGAIIPPGASIGELHFNVAAGTTVSLGNSVKLSGKLAVVKDGAGRARVSSRTGSYVGGTVVSNGTFVCTGSNQQIGVAGSTITVAAGAAFDFDGYPGYGNYEFVLDGGTISNTTHRGGAWTGAYLAKVTVLADSFLSGSYYGFQCGNGVNDPASAINMNGHTLTIDSKAGEDSFYFSKAVFSGGGKIVARNGTVYLSLNGATRVCDFGTTALEVQNSGLALGADTTIGDYTTSYTGEGDFYPENVLLVTGRFKPLGRFHTTTLLDGATLDISGLNDTWSNTCTFASSTAAVSFANGATIAVDTGARTFALGDQVIAWTTKPDASVVFTAPASVAAAEQKFTVMDDGLYVSSAAVPAYASYDVANGSWRFFKNDNTELTSIWEGGITSDMQVRFGSFAELEAIKAAGVTPNSYCMTAFAVPAETGTLDLSAGVNGTGFEIASGSVIDVQGNALVLPNDNLGGSAAFTVTDSVGGGELRVTVGENDTVANTGVSLTGQLKLVKLGAGTFVANKASQTYSGGTEVVGGVLQAMGNGTSGYYGANASTLTVRTGATFDFNGYAIGNSVFPIVLDGGTLMSTVDRNQYGNGWLRNVTLTKDSYIRGCYWGFRGYGDGNSAVTSLETNGHTLTIDVTKGNFYFGKFTVTGGGRIVGRSGGSMNLGTTASQSNWGDTTLEIQDMALSVETVTPVGDYISSYTGEVNTFWPGKYLKVSGHFTPGVRWCQCELQNGATLDLTAYDQVWTNKCHFAQSNVDGTASFASGATIMVDITGRALTNGQQIVQWNTAYNATFLPVSDDSRIYKLVADEHGLYVAYRPQTVIIVR